MIEIPQSKSKNPVYSIAIEIKINGTKLLLISVYRPPGTSFNNLLEFFSEIAGITNKYEHLIIAGDLNVRIPSFEHRNKPDHAGIWFEDFIKESPYVFLNKKKLTHKGNILDYTICSLQTFNIVLDWQSKPYPNSDHSQIQFECELPVSRSADQILSQPKTQHFFQWKLPSQKEVWGHFRPP